MADWYPSSLINPASPITHQDWDRNDRVMQDYNELMRMVDQYRRANESGQPWSEVFKELQNKDKEVTASFNLDLENNKLVFGTVANGQIANLTGDFKVSSERGKTLGGKISGDFIGEIKGNNTIPLTHPHRPNRTTNYNIMVVGSGGTGGYLIRDLARFFYALREKGDARNFSITLIDADMVEEKNVLRQNFSPRDVGKPKAAVMAKRYSAAFGIEIQTSIEMATADSLNAMINNYENAHGYGQSTHMLIGCVDNNEARRAIHETMRRRRGSNNTYWIDSGNERKSGQVVMGFENRPSIYRGEWEPERDTNFWLPSVAHLYPEVLDPEQDPQETVEESCAERSQQDTQNIFVNMTAAGHILNFIRQVVMLEKITINSIEFNIKGITNANHITEAYLQERYQESA